MRKHTVREQKNREPQQGWHEPITEGVLKMVESILDYPQPTARAHCVMEASLVPLDLSSWQLRYLPDKWAEVPRLGFRHSDDLDRLREATSTGRPFGASDFVAELGAKLKQTLYPRKRGRKPKLESEAPRPRVMSAGKG